MTTKISSDKINLIVNTKNVKKMWLREWFHLFLFSFRPKLFLCFENCCWLGHGQTRWINILPCSYSKPDMKFSWIISKHFKKTFIGMWGNHAPSESGSLASRKPIFPSKKFQTLCRPRVPSAEDFSTFIGLKATITREREQLIIGITIATIENIHHSRILNLIQCEPKR